MFKIRLCNLRVSLLGWQPFSATCTFFKFTTHFLRREKKTKTKTPCEQKVNLHVASTTYLHYGEDDERPTKIDTTIASRGLPEMHLNGTEQYSCCITASTHYESIMFGSQDHKTNVYLHGWWTLTNLVYYMK